MIRLRNRLQHTGGKPKKMRLFQKPTLQTMVNYCVDTNTDKAKAFLQNTGIQVSNNEEAKKEIMMYVGEQTKNGKGKNALQKLFDLHPDKELILDFFGRKKESISTTENFDLDGAETSATPLLRNQNAKIAIRLPAKVGIV